MAEKKEAKGKDAEGKKEKGADKAKEAKGDKKETADSPEKARSRGKVMLIGGIAGVMLIAMGVGGFFTYRTLAAKKAPEAVAGTPAAGSATHDTKEGEHDKAPAAKAEEKKAAEAHDAHAAPAAEGHGEAPKGENPAAEGEKKEGAKKKPGEFGQIFALPRMDVNVGGADLGRGYVRISVALEFEGEEAQKKELESRTPQIRDIIISTVSSRHKNDLLAKNGKEMLRKDLLNAINRVAERPVRNVYFTDFLVE